MTKLIRLKVVGERTGYHPAHVYTLATDAAYEHVGFPKLVRTGCNHNQSPIVKVHGPETGQKFTQKSIDKTDLKEVTLIGLNYCRLIIAPSLSTQPKNTSRSVSFSGGEVLIR